MPRIPRWIPWTAAAAVALMALAVGLFFWIFADDRVEKGLEERLSAEIGLPVQVGTVELTLRPRPVVDIAGLRIDGTDGPLLEIGRLQLDADPLALLEGRLEVGVIRLERPHLRLRVDADGRGNWEPLPGRPDPGTDDGEPTVWSIDAAEIVGGIVEWHDARTSATARLEDFALVAGPLAPGQEFAVQLDGRASAGEWRATVRLNTHATLDLEAVEYGLRDLALGVDLDASPVTKGPERLRVTAARASYAPRADSAAVDAVRVEGLGLQARLDARATDLATAPAVVGTLALEPFSPRLLLTRLGREAPVTQDPLAFGAATLGARFEWRAGELRLEDVDARLDDSRLTGAVGVRTGTALRWRFDLAIDRLDAERYRTPVPLRDTAPVQLPLDALRALDAEGQLRIGELRVAGARVRNAVIDLGAASVPSPRRAAVGAPAPSHGVAR